MRAVLDASALLAVILREPGAEMVIEALAHDSLMSTVNLSEVVGALARMGAEPSEIDTIVDAIPLTFIDHDAMLARDCGLMVLEGRPFGLSLGDRACLALARRSGLPVLTGDRAWLTAADVLGVDVRLIRQEAVG